MTGHPVPPATGDAPTVGDAEALGLAVHRLSLVLDRVRASLADRLDLVPIDVNALLELHHRPGIRPGDLARALNLKAAGTTSATDRLVRTGYARRAADPNDRRGTCLYLTPAGTHAAQWVLTELARSVPASGESSGTTGVLLDVADRLRRPSSPAA